LLTEPDIIRADPTSLGVFVKRTTSALELLYEVSVRRSPSQSPALLHASAVRLILGALAVLITAEQSPPGAPHAGCARDAADALIGAISGGQGGAGSYSSAVARLASMVGLGIFGPINADDESIKAISSALIGPGPNAAIEPIYFQTLPLWWLGCVYQSMLARRPACDGKRLVKDGTARKSAGVYFTPPSLVDYIVESTLAPALSRELSSLDRDLALVSPIKVLDPAMGGGHFLMRAVEYIRAEFADDWPSDVGGRVAARSVYGVDIDPVAVDIARFCLWAASGYQEGISHVLNSQLVCADAVGLCDGDFDWAKMFPYVFSNSAPGFDAAVGNPPYIAAKNGLGRMMGIGQSDSYLIFLESVMDQGLVRRGGFLGMVLPDPVLVRGNAAGVRRKLMTEWTILSLLHITGAFPDALVANLVVICQNILPALETFSATRIESSIDRHSFQQRPRETVVRLARPVRREMVLAQRRFEFLYLLEDGRLGEIVRRIHGPNSCLTDFYPPFAPLGKLNVGAIYRGEELGKSAISSGAGDLPILLGGQSIKPFYINYEGHTIDTFRVKKPLSRYLSTKILLQKSSGKLVAALDVVSEGHAGFVFPQSVYAIELTSGGMDHYYLLCILNSEVMNEYLRLAVTGYKMVQPQIELEDVRAIPIRRINFTTPARERAALVAMGQRFLEVESQRSDGVGLYSGLANFVATCLSGHPEHSDVVHDMLVHLGKQMMELTRRDHVNPNPDVTRALAATKKAIDVIVWQLYSSEPAQMSLPW